MSPSELERFLHESIPLSKAMQAQVVEVLPERVVLGAPLLPNINHRETVFGGSASALAILAAWSLLHTRLEDERVASRLVIQRNTMSYLLPIAGTFTATSSITDPDQWRRFIGTLRRKGKARITVAAELRCASAVVGHFEGVFVALASAETRCSDGLQRD